jgi:hypothetical protein
LTERENKLRAIRFEYPERIPVSFCVADACWRYYEHEMLFELMESHPLLFPGFCRDKVKKPTGRCTPTTR